MSERADADVDASTLDAVRAKIFYLASDVEAVSPHAAMLLRAVADSIQEMPLEDAREPVRLSSHVPAHRRPDADGLADLAEAGATIVAWQARKR